MSWKEVTSESVICFELKDRRILYDGWMEKFNFIRDELNSEEASKNKT